MSAVLVTTPSNLAPVRAREFAIRATGMLAASIGAARICFERDQAVEVLDRRTLFEVQSLTGSAFTYAHARPYDEPLLWAADAVAWSWVKGGGWRGSVDPMITRVIEAGP